MWSKKFVFSFTDRLYITCYIIRLREKLYYMMKIARFLESYYNNIWISSLMNIYYLEKVRIFDRTLNLSWIHIYVYINFIFIYTHTFYALIWYENVIFFKKTFRYFLESQLYFLVCSKIILYICIYYLQLFAEKNIMLMFFLNDQISRKTVIATLIVKFINIFYQD